MEATKFAIQDSEQEREIAKSAIRDARMQLEETKSAILSSGLLLITHGFLPRGTFAFFAIKGILWLLIPFVVIRWRRAANFRRRESETIASVDKMARSMPSTVRESKQAA